MSLGYTGICKKESEDDKTAVYTYAGENWNDCGQSKAATVISKTEIWLYIKNA